KKTILKDLLQICIESAVCNLPWIHPHTTNLIYMVDSHPLNILHDEEISGTLLPEDHGDSDLFEIHHILSEAIRIPPIIDKIEFLPDLGCEIPDNPLWIVNSIVRVIILDSCSQRLKDKNIGLNHLFYARTLHFQDNRGTIRELRPMHLCDGSRCQRCFFNLKKAILMVWALPLDHFPDLAEWQRCTMVLKDFQLPNHFWWKKVLPGREDLAKFYVGGA